MASVAAALLASWDADVTAGARAVFDDYRSRVQADPATPRDTGALAAGIDFPGGIQGSPASGTLSQDLVSTAVTEAGADLGTILDRSTGRVVTAASKGKRAFGPIRPPLGGNRSFIRQFRVTTAHVGWWDKANNEQHWSRAADQLARFGL